EARSTSNRAIGWNLDLEDILRRRVTSDIREQVVQNPEQLFVDDLVFLQAGLNCLTAGVADLRPGVLPPRPAQTPGFGRGLMIDAENPYEEFGMSALLWCVNDSGRGATPLPHTRPKIAKLDTTGSQAMNEVVRRSPELLA